MVCVITLNPCIDKTIQVDSIEKKNTIQNVYSIAGGKGNNVVRVLKSFNIDCIGLNIIAGLNGQYIKGLLEEEQLPVAFYEATGESRCITTVTDSHWNQIVFKEKTIIETSDLDSIIAWINSYIDTSDFICISGSSPCTVFDNLPALIIKYCKNKHIPVLLDSTGNALRNGLTEHPDFCKPNIDEISEIFNGSPYEILCKLIDMGISNPIISLGQDGALSINHDSIVRVIPPNIDVINPIGSGDSFVAGLITAFLQGSSWKDCLSIATACGVANASKWEVANFTTEEVNNYYSKVSIISFNE